MVVIFFFVGMLELPFVFQKIECTKALAEKLKKVGPGMRAVLYIA